ncbi:hypothetical protein HAX54_051859 [Datura stramonium]|uniref:Ribosomal RNA methyltransferase FtsJ domain-containing protein n=1 Tax=Datura stramonium TaxID=4076 RepID=A0ABS8SYM4_DATST|nr:hypothetical protein [Datura stramonium]
MCELLLAKVNLVLLTKGNVQTATAAAVQWQDCCDYWGMDNITWGPDIEKYNNKDEGSFGFGSYTILGKVLVDGKVITKAGTQIPDKAIVEIMAEIPKYVCRGGHKLEAAIENLGIDVAGKVALDSGLSTGGFTDCLLQYGASFVYGVDVGYGQVADKIRRDERVSVIERTNLRYLSELPQKVDLVTLDLSFISILLVMPAVVNLMKEEATLVTLIKPQFEARRSQSRNKRSHLVYEASIELKYLSYRDKVPGITSNKIRQATEM